MTNITVLKDELGLQREYREVKRKAAVGDNVVVYSSDECGIPAGTVTRVTRIGQFGDGSIDVGYPSEQYGEYSFLDADCDKWTVIEPTDIIRIDGERYRLVERKANVGERVVVVNQWFSSDTYRNGDVLTIDGMNGVDACVSSAATEDNPKGYLSLSEYRVLEPVGVAKAEPLKSARLTVDIGANPDVLGLIANLSTRLAEAERKIAALEGAKSEILGNRADLAVIDEYATKPLTRDDVIERAKADVAELSKTHWNGSGDIVYKRGIFLYKAEFIVNRDKRTVVCLLRSYTDNDVAHRGIAKCAPDDVFNMHIGRAIALRRALGLNVPEAYTDAPKPTEAKVGDIVRWIGQNGSCRKDSEILTIKERYYPRGETAERVAWRFSDGDWDYANSFEILDDSREETEVDRLICRYLISR